MNARKNKMSDILVREDLIDRLSEEVRMEILRRRSRRSLINLTINSDRVPETRVAAPLAGRMGRAWAGAFRG